MNFKIERKIENRVFSTKILYVSLGSETMTADEEKKVFEDFGYPVVDVGGSFSGEVDVIDGKVVMSNEPPAWGIGFVHNSDKRKVQEGFSAELRVNIDKIEDHLLSDTLDTKLKVAEAQCLIFEETVKQRIEKAIKDIMDKVTFFEEGYPKEFTI